MPCVVFIWIIAWVNQKSRCNFGKMFSEEPEAKEAWRWGFWRDYAVFGNGCVLKNGTSHHASNTCRPDFLNKMTASLVQDPLFFFPELIKLCLVSWLGFRSESSRRLDLSKIDQNGEMTLSFLVKGQFCQKTWWCEHAVCSESKTKLSECLPIFLCSSSFPFESILGAWVHSSHPMTAKESLCGVG